MENKVENKQRSYMAAIATYITMQTGLPFIHAHIVTDLRTIESEWTVISNTGGKFDYQLLSPREIIKATAGEFTFADMDKLVDEINAKGY